MIRRRSTGLPTHLNLQGAGYSYRASKLSSMQNVDLALVNSPFTLRDVVHAALIALPFCLASQLLQTLASPLLPFNTPQAAHTSLESTTLISQPSSSVSMIILLSLTSSTLAFTGLGAMAVRLYTLSNRAAPTPSTSLQNMNYYELGRIVALRTLVVGLPFLSLSCLGGTRVAVTTLSTIAAGILDFEALTFDTKMWRRLLSTRRWLLAVVALQTLADLAGISSQINFRQGLIGYTALASCIFTLPMAYPTTSIKTSVLSSHRLTVPSANERAGSTGSNRVSRFAECPLVSSLEDIVLTLGMAGVTAFTAFCLFVSTGVNMDGLTFFNVAAAVVASFSFAASFLFADPWSLRRIRGLGSLVASLFTLVTCGFLSSSEGGESFAHMIVFVGACFAGLNADIHMISPSSTSRSGESAVRTVGADYGTLQIQGASRITNSILPRVQAWPLLHTIIKDKDSRRIFYFMW